MKLRDYFQKNPGRGILATADASGNVDMAIYSGPYFAGDDDTPAFIMAEHLTYQNLKSNPHACFLFMEAGGWFSGKRIYMTKIREKEDAKLVDEICEQCNYWFDRAQLTSHVVFFRVDKVLPLVGGS